MQTNYYTCAVLPDEERPLAQHVVLALQIQICPKLSGDRKMKSSSQHHNSFKTSENTANATYVRVFKLCIYLFITSSVVHRIN